MSIVQTFVWRLQNQTDLRVEFKFLRKPEAFIDSHINGNKNELISSKIRIEIMPHDQEMMIWLYQRDLNAIQSHFYPIFTQRECEGIVYLRQRGLKGGGGAPTKTAVIMRQGRVMDDSEKVTNEEKIKTYLIHYYQIDMENQKDIAFVDLMSGKLSSRVAEEKKRNAILDNHMIHHLMTIYEDDFIEETLREIIPNYNQQTGAPSGNAVRVVPQGIIQTNYYEGELKLEHYITGFSNSLGSLLLENGYFNKEVQQGGQKKTIINKIIKKWKDRIIEHPVNFILRAHIELEGEALAVFLKLVEECTDKLLPLKQIVKLMDEKQMENLMNIMKGHSNPKAGATFDQTMQMVRGHYVWWYTTAKANQIKGEIYKANPSKPKITIQVLQNALQRYQQSHPDISRESVVEIESFLQFWSEFKFEKLMLEVLKELNFFEHTPNTIVLLFNALLANQKYEKAKTKLKQSTTNLTTIQNNQIYAADHENTISLADLKPRERIMAQTKKIIAGLIKYYREHENTMEFQEIKNLEPLAYINDKDIYRDYVESFLKDLESDLLFKNEKMQMMSSVILSALFKDKVTEYLTPDDLITGLEVITRKFENLTITNENTNIQQAMDTMNDVLYLMGYLGTEGFPEVKKNEIRNLTKFMQTHKLEMFMNIFKRKGKDPSLAIKRNYTNEALKRIQSTSFEKWEAKFQQIQNVLNNSIKLGRAILTGNPLDIVDILANATSMFPEPGNAPWFEHVNSLRKYNNKPLAFLEKDFITGKQHTEEFTFYFCSFLLDYIGNTQNKVRDQKRGIEILLEISFKYTIYRQSSYEEVVRKKGRFRVNKHIREYIRHRLATISHRVPEETKAYIMKALKAFAIMDGMRFEEYISKDDPSKSSSDENADKVHNDNSKHLIHKIIKETDPLMFLFERLREKSNRVQFPSNYIKLKMIIKGLEDKWVQIARDELVKIADLKQRFHTMKTLEKHLDQIHTEGDIKKTIDQINQDFNNDKDPQKYNKIIIGEAEGDDHFSDFTKKLRLHVTSTQILTITQVLQTFMSVSHSEPMSPDPHHPEDKIVLVIQGDAGTGKTLLLQAIEKALWAEYYGIRKQEIQSHSWIPLFIPLSEVKNFDRGVEEFLVSHGCQQEEIEELKTRHVMIIFDGYDEIEQAINIYDRNKLHDWKHSKVIFTSRKEYIPVIKDDPLSNFTPAGVKSAVLAVDILPIDEAQLKEFLQAAAEENAKQVQLLESQIQRFSRGQDSHTSISSLKSRKERAAKFQDLVSYLKWIDDVEDILKSPLMMKIFIETLPSLEGDSLNKGLMFEQYAKIHFDKEISKIEKIEKVPPKFNFHESFKEYSKDLAFHMYKNKKTALTARGNSYKMPNSANKLDAIWERFFNDTDQPTRIARHGAQLIEEDGAVKFIHKSIMEFFAAKAFYDEVFIFDLLHRESPLQEALVVENESAILTFLLDMIENDLKRNPKDTKFEDKMILIMNSPYFEDEIHNFITNAREANIFVRNVMLISFLHPRVYKRIVYEQKWESARKSLTKVLLWLFHGRETSKKFIDLVEKVILVRPDQRFILQILIGLIFDNNTRPNPLKLNNSNYDESIKNFIYEFDNKPVTLSLKDNSYIVSEGGTLSEQPNPQIWTMHMHCFMYGSTQTVCIVRDPQGRVLCAKDEGAKMTSLETQNVSNPWTQLQCKWLVRSRGFRGMFLLSMKHPSTTFNFNFQDVTPGQPWIKGICFTDLYGKGMGRKDTYFVCKECSTNNMLLCKVCWEQCHAKKGHTLIKSFEDVAICSCRLIGKCELSFACIQRFGMATLDKYFSVKDDKGKKRNYCNYCYKNCVKNMKNIQTGYELVDASSCDCECPSSKGGFLRGRKSTSENSGFFEVLDAFIALYKQKFAPKDEKSAPAPEKKAEPEVNEMKKEVSKTIPIQTIEKKSEPAPLPRIDTNTPITNDMDKKSDSKESKSAHSNATKAESQTSELTKDEKKKGKDELISAIPETTKKKHIDNTYRSHMKK